MTMRATSARPHQQLEPKSMSFTADRSVEHSSTFSGFRSQCTTPSDRR